MQAIFTKNLIAKNSIHGYRNLIHEWRNVIHGCKNVILGCHPWMEKCHPWMRVSLVDVIHGWLAHLWMSSMNSIRGWRQRMTDMDAAFIRIYTNDQICSWLCLECFAVVILFCHICKWKLPNGIYWRIQLWPAQLIKMNFLPYLESFMWKWEFENKIFKKSCTTP